MLQEVSNYTQLSKTGIGKSILSLVYICWSVVFLNIVKHICAKLLSCQYIKEHVCLCPHYMCMSKQGDLLFCIHSVAVSVLILEVFFYLNFYYLSLQISVFKSCFCYSSPGKKYYSSR